MKNGGAMDGAFSHSPQTVRDGVNKQEGAQPAKQLQAQQQQQPTAQKSANGLWNGQPTQP
jgi:hypothetical protein